MLTHHRGEGVSQGLQLGGGCSPAMVCAEDLPETGTTRMFSGAAAALAVPGSPEDPGCSEGALRMDAEVAPGGGRPAGYRPGWLPPSAPHIDLTAFSSVPGGSPQSAYFYLTVEV